MRFILLSFFLGGAVIQLAQVGFALLRGEPTAIAWLQPAAQVASADEAAVPEPFRGIADRMSNWRLSDTQRIDGRVALTFLAREDLYRPGGELEGKRVLTKTFARDARMVIYADEKGTAISELPADVAASAYPAHLLFGSPEYRKAAGEIEAAIRARLGEFQQNALQTERSKQDRELADLNAARERKIEQDSAAALAAISEFSDKPLVMTVHDGTKRVQRQVSLHVAGRVLSIIRDGQSATLSMAKSLLTGEIDGCSATLFYVPARDIQNGPMKGRTIPSLQGSYECPDAPKASLNISLVDLPPEKIMAATPALPPPAPKRR